MQKAIGASRESLGMRLQVSTSLSTCSYDSTHPTELPWWLDKFKGHAPYHQIHHSQGKMKGIINYTHNTVLYTHSINQVDTWL